MMRDRKRVERLAKAQHRTWNERQPAGVKTVPWSKLPPLGKRMRMRVASGWLLAAERAGMEFVS